ncbi:hypothetical protein BD324DRAFT_267046 [Kockovaella imperatae]|uniref:Uncharacterized protein n=1 Tax=Kockovaella imperatae TaxID=4999 RepID=A0A1Y1URI2_9TREE|nr:hypothetical protein BD324DRAFT_267046 [Kockovaella imperatae]ORX40217.1 hypothetical protein BD324DRAFT_267046 [Kockovaella imperatae]
MFLDHLNRPVDPSMASQYSPPSVHKQSHSVAPVAPPPQRPWAGPADTRVMSQGEYLHLRGEPKVMFGYGPAPQFWYNQAAIAQQPMAIGARRSHSAHTSILPPTPPQMPSGQLHAAPSLPFASIPPSQMIPMIQCMGQNYYPYPVPNGVYTPDMFHPAGAPIPPPMPVPIQSSPQSPVDHTSPMEPDNIEQPLKSSPDAGHSSPIRIKEFVMKNGNYTPVYDPEDLERYYKDRGMTLPQAAHQQRQSTEGDQGRGQSEESGTENAAKETRVEGSAEDKVKTTHADSSRTGLEVSEDIVDTLPNPYVQLVSTTVRHAHPRKRIPRMLDLPSRPMGKSDNVSQSSRDI